jgi:hypothetical protein
VPARTKIGATGFEPATSWSQTKRSTKLSYTPIKQVLRPIGLEPTTFSFEGSRSIQLSYGRMPNYSKIKKAGDGVRTRDLLLGKQMLYQLSYSRILLI